MKQFQVIKELTVYGSRNAKPVIVEVMQNGCYEVVSHSKEKNGYVRFGRDGKRQLAHRLSYEVFVGEIPEGMCVCHTCDIRNCINPEHLFLGTQKDNMQDCAKKGRSDKPQGEKNSNAKLMKEDVIAIRSIKGIFTTRRIATIFGVSSAHVSRLHTGKSWKHVY